MTAHLDHHLLVDRRRLGEDLVIRPLLARHDGAAADVSSGNHENFEIV